MHAYDLPQSISVLFEGLADGPATPHDEFTGGHARQENFLWEGVSTGYHRLHTTLTIQTLRHCDVDPLYSKELDVFESDSGELSLVLPRGVHDLIGIDRR